MKYLAYFYMNTLIEKSHYIFVTLLGGIAGYFLGGLDGLLTTFAIILVVDTASGMLKAFNHGAYESALFRKGILRKSGYVLAIILVVQLDHLVNAHGVLRSALLTAFSFNEIVSIVENLGDLGIKFPPMITNAIQSLNKDKEEKIEKFIEEKIEKVGE